MMPKTGAPHHECGRPIDETRGFVRYTFTHRLLAASLLVGSPSAFAAAIEGHIDIFSEGKALRAEEAQDSIV